VNFDLDERELEVRDLCRDFSRGEIAPIAQEYWDKAECPTEVLRKMGTLGLLGLLVPEEWGGIGMSTVGFVAALEEIGKADQSVAAAWQAHTTIGSLPLLAFGTDAQKDRFLRPLAEGQVLGAFGLTEPDAGSDVRAISTRAERQDGGWLINGRKAFISNAGTDMSYGVTLLARTSDPGQRGATFGSFVVPGDSAGFSTGPKLRGIGWRALDTRELYFDNVWVPDDRVLGDPFRGLAQFLATLEVGRISIAALAVSLISAVLDLSLAYAKQRKQFGKRLIDFQATQFKLADMATELEACRVLTYYAAALRDAGRPFAKEAAMAKLKASRSAVWAAGEAVQIHGGAGYMLGTQVSRFFCDAKVLEIGEGTNEIQRLVIARAISA